MKAKNGSGWHRKKIEKMKNQNDNHQKLINRSYGSNDSAYVIQQWLAIEASKISYIGPLKRNREEKSPKSIRRRNRENQSSFLSKEAIEAYRNQRKIVKASAMAASGFGIIYR